ncbi:hypothetical protein P691DRAFT_224963 [Macrolepiota fuliginosa MF-IS2]|uniref:F-box domain-containing protein n=1 Tax=Macrolepiota fuliginosa MF-IS2 TaxID=1400762 RepID=A0A9P5X7R7_9AGAR|nr:hypothetical protein P691DRAFT_224963 [Macrolepiota fuliginosa MF-IS2]
MSPRDTPIHLLPDDVLKDIFFLCIAPNDKRQTFLRRTPSYSYRISLSSVCRRWRGVIQAMPRLWANIVSDAIEDYPPVQLFHLITERSYPSVIHVDVWGAGDLHTGYPFVDPDVNPGVRYPNLVGSLISLAPHMNRCQRLKAFVTDADVAYAFAQIPFSSAGRLEELEVATQCD